MSALQCTRRLLSRLDVKPAEGAAPTTTRLGDWCANVVPLGRREVALIVSVRSLLPVTVPLAPLDRLVPDFLRTAREVLARIGVSAAAIDSELCEMAEGRIARTSSRQVLGSMTDFVYRRTGTRARATSSRSRSAWRRRPAVRSGCARRTTSRVSC